MKIYLQETTRFLPQNHNNNNLVVRAMKVEVDCLDLRAKGLVLFSLNI